MIKLKKPEQRFDEIYAIYRAAFPEDERRTYERQKAAILGEKCSIRSVEEDGKIVSFVEYWNLDNCIFIEYLASAEEWRNKGQGKHLIEACLEEADERRKPVFLEIEPVTPDDPMTERRVGFYRRMGFCLNDFHYQQPPLKDGDGYKNLMIMSYGIQIEKNEFEIYQKEIYREVYGQEV